MHDRGFSVSHVFLAAFLSVFLVIRNVHANTNTNVVASRQSIAPILSGSVDPASFVNLFIGTVNGGHVFPGATLPHGMVKVGMDTDSPGNHAGYDGNASFHVTGFSQLHDSGTGGSNGVRVELSSTRRASIQRYTYPSKSLDLPRIAVDLTNDGQQSSTDPVMLIDPESGRVTGGASFAASFGPGRYRAYTCVDFRISSPTSSPQQVAPEEYGVWLANFPIRNSVSPEQVYYGNYIRAGFVSEIGALVAFPHGTTTILVRTGVSFISSNQACANAESEIPDFDFDAVSAASRAEWNKLLGTVNVELASNHELQAEQEDMRVLLYSSLYRSHISPADYSGENPLWNSTDPYYDSFYCNWDTYRTLYPLYSLHDPVRFAQIVRGLINIQQHEGWLPECRGATAKHFIQGGSDADPILGEFLVKFAGYASSLNVSSDGLYNALLADAEKLPPNWDLQGRQVDAWIKFNYIPQDLFERGGTNSKQVSRTLEHAFGDFAISQVAKVLNRTNDGVKYAARAGNFVNVWNPNVTMPGGPASVLGMMQPRFVNGTFNYTDPRHCSGVNDPEHATCFLNAANKDGFYEGSPILYSQYVPQDTAKLVELQGGNTRFIERLDFIIDNGYFDVTDEPGQQIPFMYHYANRPGLSTQRSRQTIAQFFNTSINGLPGNDGSIILFPWSKSTEMFAGAMASYAFFYLAGLYPLPATRQLLLSSPFFPSISFTNPLFNTTTTIQAKNFRGNPTNGTGGTVFVQVCR
ncbi:glycoside hydrolase family 92 protein [Heterobasidion irregulare TC 32-1]|uniref:Glycoside hydrolase family 92 protein n=1 Tax=Heterobasidion irregulare (strain TC 32-1) TaxID=747525 RepID=W4JX10_HETIT|nr:glycoside hydrolase family 92 protein [Heterobasidion irregulare TC 32-1]ETW77620.1 glycoside hydrolase family 92 protein [Heterobasidion irregulare TC 32-1]